MPLERDVSAYLVKQAKRLRAEVRRVAWIGRRNAPDLVVFLHGSHWVETKRPKGPGPRATQQREHDRMRKKGVAVWVVHTVEQADEFIKFLEELDNDCIRGTKRDRGT